MVNKLQSQAKLITEKQYFLYYQILSKIFSYMVFS